MTVEETIGAVAAALLLLLKAAHYYRNRRYGFSRWESLRPWPLPVESENERWGRLNERLERIYERLESLEKERREPDTLRPPGREPQKPMLTAVVTAVREPDGSNVFLPVGAVWLQAGERYTFRYLVPHGAVLKRVVLSHGRLLHVAVGPHDVAWLPVPPKGQPSYILEDNHVEPGSVVAVTVEGTPE